MNLIAKTEMKKQVILIILAIGLFFIANAQELKVATYNVRFENLGDVEGGNGWQQRCPVITQLIRFHNFDIFGAQEVLFSQLSDMLNELKDYSYIGVGRTDGINEGEFSPIFYKKEKFELLNSGTFWLADTTNRPVIGWDAALPRICTWGKFKIKDGGKTFWFFNVHMDHVGLIARVESSKLIIEKIKSMCSNDPVILVGDFNSNQTSEGYKFICSSNIFQDSFETTEIRYALNGTTNKFNPGFKTDKRIDHIFASYDFVVKRYGVLTDSYRSEPQNRSEEIKSSNFPKELSSFRYDIKLPSDHYPVMVEVKFKK